jgi:hypothetical protein
MSVGGSGTRMGAWVSVVRPRLKCTDMSSEFTFSVANDRGRSRSRGDVGRPDAQT